MYKREKEQERERKLQVEKMIEEAEKSPRPTPRIDLEERQKEMIAQAKQKREQIEKASLERKQQVMTQLLPCMVVFCVFFLGVIKITYDTLAPTAFIFSQCQSFAFFIFINTDM